MQIKTIVGIFADKFDEEVNKHLADGWELGRRDIVKTPQGAIDKFYAELVKHDEPNPNNGMIPTRWCQR